MANDGSRFLIRNLELARRLNDPEAFWMAAFHRLGNASAPHHAVDRLNLARELAEKSHAGRPNCCCAGLPAADCLQLRRRCGGDHLAFGLFRRHIRRRSEDDTLLRGKLAQRGGVC